MKILIIQLARLGDIYMSWPAMRALRRANPNAEIHLLTRPRFEGAVEGLSAIDHHISLPVSHILEPLVQGEIRVDQSLERLGAVLKDLSSEKYDWIINLTFSPSSSFIAHALSHPETRMSGYTRYADGSLHIADEMSAYFYAQVGTQKANRVHIADIFASMLDLDYTEDDWAAPQVMTLDLALPERYIVMHVGASEQHKSLGAEAWFQICKEVIANNEKMSVVLIGSADEQVIGAEIMNRISDSRVINLIGQTRISQIFGVIQEAELLVGCDSAPIHMASLTDTPTFNVSTGRVNFWETGPKATLSFIYRVNDSGNIDAFEIGQRLCEILNGEVSRDLIVRTSGVSSYEKVESESERFQWDLVCAIYLGSAYPIAEKMEIVQGAIHCSEVNDFARDQIALVPRLGIDVVAPLLDRADEIIHTIGLRVPELQPLVSWYQAEKVRIGPGTTEQILASTLRVHERFAAHLSGYVPDNNLALEKELVDGEI